MKDSSSLLAISPVDGRYCKTTKVLAEYFSEYALIKYRVKVEVEYFKALGKKKLLEISKKDINALDSLVSSFAIKDAQKIKAFEKTTNHDVKAVEYYLKEKLEEIGLSKQKEFVHFGLTSQDINNTAVPLSVKESLEEIYFPTIDELLKKLEKISLEWKNKPMLARTHGQAASPTTIGKEIAVFIVRIKEQLKQMHQIPFSAKFGGATGNFNAHNVAFPSIDWHDFANKFVRDLGLTRSYPTTQIEHYDNIASLLDCMNRINIVLIDFSRDIWTYISMDYFKQKVVKNEVGSSAMPHKVNPIDFENAEGNLGVANAICNHLSRKLPISRLQRDLTDSTVLRNIGMPFAHTLISFTSLQRGISKLILNEQKINKDLESNWAVVSEAIQTILRREGFVNPYEKLKDFTRGKRELNREDIKQFIAQLKISNKLKEELRAITPQNYIGSV